MRARAKFDPATLLCSEPGCTRPWTSNFGRRCCALHAWNRPPEAPGPRRGTQPTTAIPVHAAVRPFVEPYDREDAL